MAKQEDTLNKPKLRPGVEAIQLDGDGVLFVGERGYDYVPGSAMCLLVDELNGQFSEETLFLRFGDRISRAEIRFLIAHLAELGYLSDHRATGDKIVMDFWGQVDASHQSPGDILPGASVSVSVFGDSAYGDIDLPVFTEGLAEANISVHEQGQLEVILVESYLDASLAEMNEAAVVQGRPFLLCKPVGSIVWIGPLVVPGKTACWACLSQRLKTTMPAEYLLRKAGYAFQPTMDARGGSPLAQKAALKQCVKDVARWFAGNTRDLEGVLTTYDTITPSIERHIVTRWPQCPSCGDPDLLNTWYSSKPDLLVHPKGPDPKRLQQKRPLSDGGFRTVTPEETVQRHLHHISPITGVISHLHKASSSDNDLVQVYDGQYYITPPVEDIRILTKGLTQLSAGKGISEAQAKASAFCEAIERFSGAYRGDEIIIPSSYHDLQGRGIHPNRCMHFSEKQYAQREVLNKQNGTNSRYRIPLPLDEHREIAWTPLWSLTDGKSRYLPTAFCYTWCPDAGQAYCVGDGNGNAAGNTQEEAMLQGFMELVERDAIGIWWFNRISRPGVDVDSFDSAYFDRLRACYSSLGREFWVLDVTADFNIPTFVSLSRRLKGQHDEITLGFGAHFDPTIALMRAVTEMNQQVPLIRQMNEARQAKGPAISLPADVSRWMSTVRLDAHDYLKPGAFPFKTATDYPFETSNDLVDVIHDCIEQAREKGMEMLVLNQTRPEIGMPVVKVVVPGLRHYWTRTGPGRLYDVPVELGWLDQPKKEQELNPVTLLW